MLVNGKEVNHLIIGGETFDSRIFLPALYKFGNTEIKYYYELSIVDGNLELKKEQTTVEFWTLGLRNQITVYQILNFEGEKYALVRCYVEFAGGSTLANVWIKVSEAGGMTRIDVAGG